MVFAFFRKILPKSYRLRRGYVRNVKNIFEVDKMNLYLKLIGALMLLVCSFLASSEYRRRIFRQTEEYRSVLSLLRHAVDKVHLMDGREEWSGLEDEILESVGILPALRGGQGIRAAFEECKDGLSLDKATKDMITVQLSKLGDGYTENLGHHSIKAVELCTAAGKDNTVFEYILYVLDRNLFNNVCNTQKKLLKRLFKHAYNVLC